jgi:ankyrin repeat protein
MFFRACSDGDSEAVRQLLKSGEADANDYSDEYDGGVPLQVACGSLDTMRVLLGYGADLDAMDLYGRTVLHYACENFGIFPNSVRFLLDHGANVNARTNAKLDGIEFDGREAEGVTPLQFAVVQSIPCTSLVRLLLDRGADIHMKDTAGRTALFMACGHPCQIGVVKMLLDHGANINDTTDEGETPLHAAINYVLSYSWHKDKSRKMVDLLLANGAYLSRNVAKGDEFASRLAFSWYCHHQPLINIGPSGEHFSWVLSLVCSELCSRFPSYASGQEKMQTNKNNLAQPAILASVLFDMFQKHLSTLLLFNHTL